MTVNNVRQVIKLYVEITFIYLINITSLNKPIVKDLNDNHAV